jgi:protein gp37
MPSRSGIEWTEFSWNPWVGCEIVSAGCTNCYAARAAARIEEYGAAPAYRGLTQIVNGNPVWTGKVNRGSRTTWNKPHEIREPSLIFVCSMADSFHPAAPDAWRLEALEVMRRTPHTYQLLTKRAEEIAPFMERTGARFSDNTWIGATVERADAVHRIDILRSVPAALRFLSIEPLLGPLGPLNLAGIGWVITGGESGLGARPMAPEWLREVRDACIAQRVPHYLKQFGSPRNNPLFAQAPPGFTGPQWVAKHDPIGKGGSLLDGRSWKEFPAAARAAGQRPAARS